MPVHYVDFGGPDGAPTVVLVHGLGGSHLNWDLFAPLLRPHARVLALDLPGFGRSEPGDRRTTVHDNVAGARPVPQARSPARPSSWSATRWAA